MFHINQKVVCIDDDWTGPRIHLVPHLPVKGVVYTIRALAHEDGWVFVRLVEIVNPIPDKLSEEPSFLALSFRPVVERKTDIAIFHRMLLPSSDKVPAL